MPGSGTTEGRRSVRQRYGYRYRQLQRIVYARETHCWLCGEYVDQTLHHNDRMARTVDHVIPLELGGAEYDLTNCRLAHRRCNSSKADGLAVGAERRPSRAWL